ncbi:MAG: ComEC/Rec2 family competence protein [Halocynthiibacter sp.]
MQFRFLSKHEGPLIPWAAVAMGTGIVGYFELRFEPPLGVAIFPMFLALVFYLWARPRNEELRLWLLGLVVMLLGFQIASFSAHLKTAPVLSYPYYGPIEGRVVKTDRSHSGKIRVTLDRVILERLPPKITPKYVRLSLHDQNDPDQLPQVGQTLQIIGRLAPPSGPVEPDGFNFRRMAWFQKLGAVGYSRKPIKVLAPQTHSDPSLWVGAIRQRMSSYIVAQMPAPEGGFAAAILTGDRSHVPKEVTQNLRRTNLSHLLAISGLHMGVLTGVVYWIAKYAASIFVALGRLRSAKPTASLVALAFGFLYLLLSGGNIATQRAFIMVAVALTAMFFGRKGISLRTVAIAAFIILTLSPVSLLSPGFQMSFAATTALVLTFSRITYYLGERPAELRFIISTLTASLVAGAATAPFAAAHFNQFAQYGFVANVISVPLMGLVIIPAAFVALIFAPLSLDWIGFWAMEWGIKWILAVASFFSNFETATMPVIAPPLSVLPLIAGGVFFACTWAAPVRWAGLAVAVLGGGIWFFSDRPEILVAFDGSLVGRMGEDGRILSKARGGGFSARVWLENDGDLATQKIAAARASGTQISGGAKGIWRDRYKGHEIVHLWGKRGHAQFKAACETADIVIMSERATGADIGPCDRFDLSWFRKNGAGAIHFYENGYRITTAQQHTGTRLWSAKPRRKWRSKKN